MSTQQRAPVCGQGSIEIEAVKSQTAKHGEQEWEGKSRFYPSEIIAMKHSYPFRYLVPEKSTSGTCRWIFPMTFGGGLVGGDKVTSTIKVGEECATIISSQESTKVYHCNQSGQTVQHNIYSVGESSLLCILQDPIVCYRDADFDQKQVIRMTPSSNLVLLDWLLCGRVALNESWSFKRYYNCIEVQVSDETIIRDRTELEDTPNKTVAQAMLGFQVFGTCIVLGDQVAFLAEKLVSKYGRKRDIGEAGDQNLVVSVSYVKYEVQGETISGCYLRFLAADMKAAAPVVQSISSPLVPILGDDPFERKL